MHTIHPYTSAKHLNFRFCTSPEDLKILERHDINQYEIGQYLDKMIMETEKRVEQEKKLCGRLASLSFCLDDKFRITVMFYGTMNKRELSTTMCSHCKEMVAKKLEYFIENFETSEVISLSNFAVHLLKMHADFGIPNSKYSVNAEQICKAILYDRKYD